MTEEKKDKCICGIAIGIILIVVGLLADTIGLGGGPGFGPKQIGVIVLGVVLLGCGMGCGSNCLCKKKQK